MPGIQPGFFQEPPLLENGFAADRLLKAYVAWKFRGENLSRIEDELADFGQRCSSEINAVALAAEAQVPRHVPFDPWGRRIDHLEMSPAWAKLDRISAEEGLVAIGYERREGDLSRVRQFAKLYLFHPSSAFYSCPLAMTDAQLA